MSKVRFETKAWLVLCLALILVISTLFSAGLFQPLRLRVQRFIGRRFYRSMYDAARTLAAFALAAGDEVDLVQLRGALIRITQETMQPGWRSYGHINRVTG